MNDSYEKALQLLEEFRIDPPIFTQADGNVLKYDPSAGAINPVAVEYPGLRTQIPGLESITIQIVGDNWMAYDTVPINEAGSAKTIEAKVRSIQLKGRETFTLQAHVYFKVEGEEDSIHYQSLDNVYEVSPEEA